MTDNIAPPPAPAADEPAATAPQSVVAPPAPAHYGAPMAYGTQGPAGKVRETGMCVLLYVVTLGIYGIVWYYKTHDEMKRHTGSGIGGGIALLLAFFVGIVSPFISSSEVGALYERAGKEKPVGGATGLWYFPGIFILVGPVIWFVKTNGALNDYWRSQAN